MQSPIKHFVFLRSQKSNYLKAMNVYQGLYHNIVEENCIKFNQLWFNVVKK